MTIQVAIQLTVTEMLLVIKLVIQVLALVLIIIDMLTRLHHVLLLFSQLVKAVPFIMSVCHNTCDLIRHVVILVVIQAIYNLLVHVL